MFTERQGGYNLRQEVNMRNHYATTKLKKLAFLIYGAVLWKE